MKKNTITVKRLLIVVSIALFVFAGCGKNDKNTAQEEKSMLDKSDVVLPKGVGLSGFNIDDTVNWIKGQVVFARNLYKSDDNKDIKPANQCWEADLKEFSSRINANNLKNAGDTNIYIVKIRSIVEFEDIISAVYERTMHFSGSKDTIKDLLLCNYDEDSGKALSFFDIFNVNEGNLSSFNKLFGSDYTLGDLRTIHFYFTRTDLVLTKDVKSTEEDKRAARNSVKKFFIDD